MKITFKSCIALLLLFCVTYFAISCRNGPPEFNLITSDIEDITQTGASSGGNISTRKSSPFISRGVCWSTEEEPTIRDNNTLNGNETGNFLSKMTGLNPGTRYYVRAYVLRSADTLYGNILSFVTEKYGMVMDIDGNEYKTINIGNQTWMAENLKTTRYTDGSVIPLVQNEIAWAGLSAPGYSWYENEEAGFKDIYGALYNWYVINTGKLCPEGWHAATDAEWKTLTDYLGGTDIAGGKIKETGITYWVEPNTGATNESCFSALPGGFRYFDGNFFDFGFSGYWWCSGQYSESRAWFRFLSNEDSVVFRFNNIKKNGFSVRCIKD